MFHLHLRPGLSSRVVKMWMADLTREIATSDIKIAMPYSLTPWHTLSSSPPPTFLFVEITGGVGIVKIDENNTSPAHKTPGTSQKIEADM